MSNVSPKDRLYLIAPSPKPARAQVPGKLMSQTLSTPSPGRLAASAIEMRIHSHLKRLDAEQLQVVELVIAAISRGAR